MTTKLRESSTYVLRKFHGAFKVFFDTKGHQVSASMIDQTLLQLSVMQGKPKVCIDILAFDEWIQAEAKSLGEPMQDDESTSDLTIRLFGKDAEAWVRKAINGIT